MRILASQHTDPGIAGCRPQEVCCVQRAGGPGAASRYATRKSLMIVGTQLGRLTGFFRNSET